jgi:hypothetical protein
MFLLADSIVFGPSSLITLLVGLFGGSVPAAGAGALALYVLQKLFTRPAPTPAIADTPAGKAQRLVELARAVKVGPIATLLQKLANRDAAGVQGEIEYLHRQAEEKGGLAFVFEQFVHEHVPVLLGKGDDRQELLALIGKHEGVDLVKLIEGAKAKSSSLPIATAIGSLAGLVLCLTLSSSAAAMSPEKFVPQFRAAVIDAPALPAVARQSQHSTLQHIYSELGRPQGGASSCACEPACACERSSGRGGFWQRGRVRRAVAGIGRFVVRRLRWRRC